METLLPLLHFVDFPVAAPKAPTHSCQIRAKKLHGLLKAVAFAASTEETRYYLLGIYLHMVDGGLRAVATDGHRLALAAIPQLAGQFDVVGIADMPGIIVPSYAVAALLPLLEKTGEEEWVTVDCREPGAEGDAQSFFRIATDVTVLTCRPIDGAFPDYTRVIPAPSVKPPATYNRLALIGTIKRLIAGSDSREPAVRCDRNGFEARWSVAHSTDGGASVEKLETNHTGVPFSFGMNGKYLLASLTHLSGDSVRIDGAGPKAPFRVDDPADADVLHVVMPMRV